MSIPIVFMYTDAQAVSDGVLVDLDQLGAAVRFHGADVNRLTGHLFGAFADPCEPLVADDLRDVLQLWLSTATDTAEPGEERDHLYELCPFDGKVVWLERNEVHGWTVMFASDR